MEKDSMNMEEWEAHRKKLAQEHFDKKEKEQRVNLDYIEEVVEKLYNHEKQEIAVIDPKNKDWVAQLNNTIELLTSAVENIYLVCIHSHFSIEENKHRIIQTRQRIIQNEYKIAELEKRLEYYTKKGGSNKLYKNIKTIKNRFKRNI